MHKTQVLETKETAFIYLKNRLRTRALPEENFDKLFLKCINKLAYTYKPIWHVPNKNINNKNNYFTCLLLGPSILYLYAG